MRVREKTKSYSKFATMSESETKVETSGAVEQNNNNNKKKQILCVDVLE
jgi:hypothetical protein